MKKKDADIAEVILTRYGIDIREDNILKKYHLNPSGEISREDLIRLLNRQKEEWRVRSTNTNPTVAGRAKKELSNEESYRAILLDDQLRCALFMYYRQDGAAGSASNDEVAAAREFFTLVKKTKSRITREDADFYFDFYKLPGKSRKAIRQMLESEFKLRSRKGDEPEGEPPAEDSENNGKTAPRPSGKTCNNFSRETLLAVSQCRRYLSDVARSKAVTSKGYPQLTEDTSIYEFLCGTVRSAVAPTKEVFSDRVHDGRNRAARLHNENLQEHDFQHIVNFFNKLSDLLAAKDVQDNFPEFLLLLKYPGLSSYMYEFEEVKPKTLHAFYDSVAQEEYQFGSFNLFVTDYFMPMYSHFGILEHPLRSVFKEAQGAAGKERVRRNCAEKLRTIFHIPGGVKLRHMLPYWPVYLVYFIFELLKGIATYLKQIVTAAGVLASVAMAVYLAADGIASNRLDQWLVPVTTGLGFLTVVDFFICLVQWIMYMVLIAGIPAALAYLLREYAASLYKAIDWIGYERTFHRILHKCRDNAERKRKNAASGKTRQ